MLNPLPDDESKSFVKRIVDRTASPVAKLLTTLLPEFSSRNCTPEAWFRQATKKYQTNTIMEPAIELMAKSELASQKQKVLDVYNDVQKKLLS